MPNDESSPQQLSLVLLLAALLVLLPVDQSAAEFSSVAPNQWRDQCVLAVTSMERAENGSILGMEARYRKHWRRASELLRPSADAGHLPSIYFLLSMRSVDLEKLGLPSLVDREALAAALYEGRFPLASKPIPADAFSGGFQGNHKLPPRLDPNWSEKLKKRFRDTQSTRANYGEYITHAESAKLRSAYIEAKRWSAARGNVNSWGDLAFAYERIVEDWGGGVEYRIEQYAWLELQKRLIGMEPQYNVYSMQQVDLERKFERGLDLARARELADRYVEVLWPRRIEMNPRENLCRLQPQFASDPVPYSDEPAVLRVLEMPKPPKDPVDKPFSPRVITIELKAIGENCGPGIPNSSECMGSLWPARGSRTVQ